MKGCCFNKLKIVLIFFFIVFKLFSGSILFAQDKSSPDALITLINNASEGKKVELALWHFSQHKEKAIENIALKFLKQDEQLAKKSGNDSLRCLVFENYSRFYDIKLGYNKQSIDALNKAILLAKSKEEIILAGLYNFRLGQYYARYNNNATACSYFLEADDLFRRAGYNKTPNLFNFFYLSAIFYYQLDDLEYANRYLLKASSFKNAALRDKINLFTMKGLIFRKLGDLNKAENTLTKTLELANANKDSAWIAITSGNLGSILEIKGENSKALKLFEYDFKESSRLGEYSSACNALLRIILLNIKQNHIYEAQKRMPQLAVVYNKVQTEILQRLQYYTVNAKLNEKLGNDRISLAYYKKIDAIKDTIKNREDLIGTEKAKIKWQEKKHDETVEEFNDEQNIKNLVLIGVSIIVCLLAIICILIFKKQQREKTLLVQNQLLVEKQLNFANSELEDFTKSLKDKQELINKFKTEIGNLKAKSNLDIEQLEAIVNTHLMTEDNWNNFKALFNRVYPNFFKDLRKSHPSLTNSDLRILALSKLDISNNEMSNILGITVDGVKKAKQRLRKKMSTVADIVNEDYKQDILH